MPATSDPVIVYAENIAVSYLLCSVPAPPSHNHADCLPAFKRPSILSFNTERKLAGTLAFIVHSKDDVDHIPALCLVEDPEPGNLKVIYTVNKASYNNGEDAIRRIKQGFEYIFVILATVSGE